MPALVLGIAIDTPFVGTRPFDLPLVPDAYVPETRAAQFWVIVGMVAFVFLAVAGLDWRNSWAWSRFAQHRQHGVRGDD